MIVVNMPQGLADLLHKFPEPRNPQPEPVEPYTLTTVYKTGFLLARSLESETTAGAHEGTRVRRTGGDQRFRV